MSTISIVMPTHNRSGMLAESIRSILQQTWTDWELIIVDDGSTDDTAAVVASFNDRRISLVAQPHTGHITANRLKGAALSKGDWIAFMDSDDLWETDKLKIQMEWLQQFPEVGFTFSNAWHFGDTNDHPRDFEKLFVGDVLLPMLRDQRFIVFLPSLLFNKTVLSSISSLNYPAIRNDMEFFYLLALRHKGLFTNQRLIRVRKHVGGHSHSQSTIPYIEHIELLHWLGQQHHLDAPTADQLIARAYYTLGIVQARLGNFGLATDAFSHSARGKNLMIKSFLRGAWAKIRS